MKPTNLHTEYQFNIGDIVQHSGTGYLLKIVDRGKDYSGTCYYISEYLEGRDKGEDRTLYHPVRISAIKAAKWRKQNSK